MSCKKQGPPCSVLELVCNTLAEISDEVGEEELGGCYLLKYEGWGGCCVEHVWQEVVEEQERQETNIETEKAKEKTEEACYAFAEAQSQMIIENEWIPKLKARGYSFVDGGFDHGGLYGRAWALFKRSACLKIGKTANGGSIWTLPLQKSSLCSRRWWGHLFSLMGYGEAAPGYWKAG